MNKKYYAVRIGRTPGVYSTWEECKEQVDGFSGAVYKSFSSFETAEDYAFPASQATKNEKAFVRPMIAYTDGSFSNGRGSWGYVLIENGKPLLTAYGPCTKSASIRNIGGEIEAAEEAIRKAMEMGADYLQIFHDYEGVGRWGNDEWKTARPDTQSYLGFVKCAREKLAIEFVKVKGHQGNKYNEVADRLARKGLSAEERVENLISGEDELATIRENVDVDAETNTARHEAIIPDATKKSVLDWCRANRAFLWELEDRADGSEISPALVYELCEEQNVAVPVGGQTFVECAKTFLCKY